jgi:hypothetical protein
VSAIVKAAGIQISPVLYSRQGTVEKVVKKLRELGNRASSSRPSRRPSFRTTPISPSYSRRSPSAKSISACSNSRSRSRLPRPSRSARPRRRQRWSCQSGSTSATAVRSTIRSFSSTPTRGIAPAEAGAASGLSNMLRNLGGAVGTATLSTVLAKREQFHSNIIGQAVTLTRDEVRQRISDLMAYFMAHGVPDPAHAQHEAIVHRQDRPATGRDHGLQRHFRCNRCAPCRGRNRGSVRP